MDPLIPTSARGGIEASDIHPNDVLCGRGCVISSHPGNEYFRKLIESKNVAYANSRSKREKTGITWNIIEEIKARTPPGRFLTKPDSPRGKRKKSKQPQIWYEIDDTKAREKVAQALREKAPQLRDVPVRKQPSERRERGDGKRSISNPQREGRTASPHFNGTANQQPHVIWKRPATSSNYTSFVSTVAGPSNEDKNCLVRYAGKHDHVAQQSSTGFAACVYNEKQHSSPWNAQSGQNIVSKCISNESSEASDLDRRKKSRFTDVARSEASESAGFRFSPISFLKPETRYKCSIHHQNNASSQLPQQSSSGHSYPNVDHPLDCVGIGNHSAVDNASEISLGQSQLPSLESVDNHDRFSGTQDSRFFMNPIQPTIQNQNNFLRIGANDSVNHFCPVEDLDPSLVIQGINQSITMSRLHDHT